MTTSTPALQAPSGPPSGRVGAAPVRRRPGGLERRRARAALGFLAPALLVLVVFVVWPMLSSAWISLTDAGLINAGEFVGLENYRDLGDDERFHGALVNTLVYAAVTTPVSVVLALALAVVLDRAIRGREFFRTALFLPFVASLSITSIAWSFLFDPQVGAVIAWLDAVGVPTGNGLRDPALAMPAVMVVGIWRNVGFFMVMFLAGLQSVPRDVLEAARVDGAGAWRRFWHVTLPLLSNTTMFVTIIAVIFAFQAFDQMYVMTGGGPFFRTEPLVMLVYARGFEDYDMGSATAISWVLVAIVLAVSLLQLGWFRRREVRY